jgi:hypothetical protein
LWNNGVYVIPDGKRVRVMSGQITFSSRWESGKIAVWIDTYIIAVGIFCCCYSVMQIIIYSIDAIVLS